MSFFKYIAPAVAIASSAYAQCSTSGTLTVTNTADVASIAGCSTYSGSIAIATAATSIALDGPSKITGDVVAEPNGMLGTFSASSLKTIGGTLSLSQLQLISMISLPALTSVNTFSLSALGQNLLALDLGNSFTQVSTLTIDNTYLNNLDGIAPTTADNITVTNNILLSDLTLPIKNVSGQVAIRGNPRGLNVGLSNLVSAGDLFVNDCTDLALDSFANSSGIVAFIDNNFQSLSMPNFTVAAMGLAVQSNSQLSNLTMPNLRVVGGGLDVTANPKLSGTISFPKLEAAQSGDFEGTYSSVNLPALQRIPGHVTFASTKDISSTCSKYTNDIGGTVDCKSNDAEVTASSSGTSATSTHNAAAQFTATSATTFGVFGGLAALISMFM